MNSPNSDRLGIAKLQKVFANVGWFFREQFVEDYGIDAQVEIVNQGRPTGQLIALQVKSGRSYCKELKDGSIIYRPDPTHVEYWLSHHLPVVVVIYSPDEDAAYWCPVADGYIQKTRKGYKMSVPRIPLDEESAPALTKVFKLNVPLYRFNKLLLDLPWMQLVGDGYQVSVEFDDWVNKSLSRSRITISCETEDGRRELTIPQHYAPGVETVELIERMLPWAQMKMDVDAYQERREFDYDEYLSSVDYDEEDDPDAIVPIESNGEIDTYRVLLELNEIGRSFLRLSGYLYDQSDFELRVFSVDEV